MPDAITAPAAPLTVVARRAYPSPLKAARPSTDSLCSPMPGRLASRCSLLGNFLPALTSLSLVNRSLFAALTALYLLRESFESQSRELPIMYIISCLLILLILFLKLPTILKPLKLLILCGTRCSGGSAPCASAENTFPIH